MAFEFIDPGAMVDGELELVEPHERWIEPVLASCAHPLTKRDAPREAQTTRAKLFELMSLAPRGHQPDDPAKAWVPQYHFWMRLSDEEIPIPMAGGIGLRIGATKEIELYSGNIGYHVYPPARGRHFAERACRLLLPIAKRHGMQTLWITCNPDNIASRRTCERLGAELVEIVAIPMAHPFRSRGETAKCRFVVDLKNLVPPSDPVPSPFGRGLG